MCDTSVCVCVCDYSSKVEMGKWIEDLNLAIDMSKKSQEKSSIFLDSDLGDHSNRKSFSLGSPQSASCDVFMSLQLKKRTFSPSDTAQIHTYS